MPHIDRYIQKQIYADPSVYQKRCYGLRLYSDFYHTFYGVQDRIIENRLMLKPEFQKKLGFFWNLGLENNLNLKDSLNTRIKLKWKRKTKPHSYSVFKKRPLPVSFRVGLNFFLDSVKYQMAQISRILKDHVQLYSPQGFNRINKRAYVKELTGFKILLSPFGWGEICYRDFESFSAGGLLLKLSMDHLIIWPNLFKPDKTFISFKWDFSDLVEKINHYLDQEQKRLDIAETGQKYYLSFWGEEGFPQFLEDFNKNIIKQETKSSAHLKK